MRHVSDLQSSWGLSKLGICDFLRNCMYRYVFSGVHSVPHVNENKEISKNIKRG